MDLNKVFRAAAKRALAEWEAHQYDRQAADLDDLTQDLWVWYSETPTTREKIGKLNVPQAVETVRKKALQILSRDVLDANTFQGKSLYSSEAVRAALLGETTNKYVASVLPYALMRLQKRNKLQAEALRSRYTDNVVPARGSAEEAVLRRAVKSLTQEVNVIFLTNNENRSTVGSAAEPGGRRRRGDHSDPTATAALNLLDKPELRHEYLKTESLQDFLGPATPVFTYEGFSYRPPVSHAALLTDYPRLVEPYMRLVRERLG